MPSSRTPPSPPASISSITCFLRLRSQSRPISRKSQTQLNIAATAGVGFTINHIAAVVIPASFGLLWLASPAAVFLSGAAMAAVSLALSFNVPMSPAPGNEVVHGHRGAVAAAE